MYYRYIDGNRYDASLISNARFRTRAQGDGRISLQDAQDLWRIASDGTRLTETEEFTFEYLFDQFNWTKPAQEFINEKLEQGIAEIQSFYKVIDGQRYDRRILEAADRMLAGRGDGRISQDDAEELVPLFADMGDISETETRTIAYLYEQYKWTPQAKTYFKEQTDPISRSSTLAVQLRELLRQKGLERLQLSLDEAEIIYQRGRFGDQTDFVQIIDLVTNTLFKRGHSSLAWHVANIFELYPEVDNHETLIDNKIKELLVNGCLHLLADPSRLEESQIVFDMPPNGETLEENWLFVLELDDLSDLLFYVLRPRDGGEGFIYGVN